MPASPIVPRHVIFLVVTLTLVWGTNWPLLPYAVREVSIWTFRSIAMAGAGLAMLLFAYMRGMPLLIPRRFWKTVVLATIIYQVVWNIGSTYAAILIPSGQAAVLGFTMPLWGALIAWAFFGESLSPRLLLAVLLGGAGVVLLMAPSFATYSAAPLGLMAGLTSAICWAIGTQILKRGNVLVPVLVLTGWQVLLASIPITAVALLMGDGKWFMPSWQSIAVIAWITLIPMSIGTLCWFSIVGILPANIAGLSSVMVPVVAMVSGAIVHGEPLGPLQLISMAACVAALVLALGQKAQPPENGR